MFLVPPEHTKSPGDTASAEAPEIIETSGRLTQQVDRGRGQFAHTQLVQHSNQFRLPLAEHFLEDNALSNAAVPSTKANK